jgi:hypothetical protein
MFNYLVSFNADASLKKINVRRSKECVNDLIADFTIFSKSSVSTSRTIITIPKEKKLRYLFYILDKLCTVY